MKAMTLKDFLEDMELMEKPEMAPSDRGRSLTLWVSNETHARFIRLQKQSRLKFGKKFREALIAMMDIAEARTS